MSRTISKPGDEFYRVRIHMRGTGVMYLASETEPVVLYEGVRVAGVLADWMTDPDKGDTLGFVDPAEITGVTWRWTGDGESSVDDPDLPDSEGDDE